jgi:hypothetical protein
VKHGLCSDFYIMSLRATLLVATVLVALMAAYTLRDALRWARSGTLSPTLSARVGGSLRRYALLVGLIEGGALIALTVALFRVPPGSPNMWWVGLAILCVGLMIGVWGLWLRPLELMMATWTPETQPADHTHHHARRSRLHGIRAILAILALALLLIGVAASTVN